MAYEDPGVRTLDYAPCHYGTSRLMFRGPRRRLDAPYVAVVGGSETYGKFVAEPFPAIAERLAGLTVVNLGHVNAGPDLFLNDSSVMEVLRGAAAVVIQIVGAANISNRFYAVHPRRNDRFLRAAPQLTALYRDVDFTDFHFTRHMLKRLNAAGPDRFAAVESELRAAWLSRMGDLVRQAGRPVVLLWIGNHRKAPAPRDPLAQEPLFVDETMVAALRGPGVTVLRVNPSDAARAEGSGGMVCGAFDHAAAAELPGPAVHREIAAALAPRLRDLCGLPE